MTGHIDHERLRHEVDRLIHEMSSYYSFDQPMPSVRVEDEYGSIRICIVCHGLVVKGYTLDELSEMSDDDLSLEMRKFFNLGWF